jgi:hypothetical protein
VAQLANLTFIEEGIRKKGKRKKGKRKSKPMLTGYQAGAW